MFGVTVNYWKYAHCQPIVLFRISDSSWWYHEMVTFSCLLWGNLQVTGWFPCRPVPVCGVFILMITPSNRNIFHYDDVIMGAIASQITSLTIVYSTVYSDADQRKHQSSASLAFVRGIHRGPTYIYITWIRYLHIYFTLFLLCEIWLGAFGYCIYVFVISVNKKIVTKLRCHYYHCVVCKIIVGWRFHVPDMIFYWNRR